MRCGLAAMMMFAATVLAQHQPGGVELEISDGLVTLNVRGAGVEQTVRELAAQAGFDLVVSGEVRGSVNSSLQAVTLGRAIDELLRDHSFVWLQDPGGFGCRDTLWVYGEGDSGPVARWFHDRRPADVDDRLDLIESLSRTYPDDAIGQLQGMLYDERVEIREAAIRSLAEFDSADAAAVLALALADSDPGVRQDVVDALGDMDNSAAAQYLLQALGDPDELVRAVAAERLAELAQTVQ